MNIVVVDDDPDILESLGLMLDSLGHKTIPFSGARSLVAALNSGNLPHDVHLVMLDVLMPEMDGIELIRILREHHAHLPIVAMSGGSKRLSAALGLKASEALGATAILQKPFRLETLEKVLEEARAA